MVALQPLPPPGAVVDEDSRSVVERHGPIITCRGARADIAGAATFNGIVDDHRHEHVDAPRLERLDAQLLTRREPRKATDVVAHLLAIQAQDLRAGGLAVRARTAGVTEADVHRGLSEDRSLAVGWLNRGTLHLVAAEDYWWLHTLTARRTTTSTMRRLAEEGVSAELAERAVRAVVGALGREGPLQRAGIEELLAADGVPRGTQAVVHVLALASLRGQVMRGPVVDGSQAFVPAAEWLAPPPGLDHDAALVRLAGRYLAGHGPATAEDLARWSGLPLRDARRGIAGVPGLRDRGHGLAALAPRRHAEPPTPPPRLLGAFDPVLLGWRSREDVLGPYAQRIVSGGVLRACALVGGRARGTWRLRDGRAELALFEELDHDVVAALDADARDVERFLIGAPGVGRPSRG